MKAATKPERPNRLKKMSSLVFLLPDFLEWKRYLSMFVYILGSFHFRNITKNNEAGHKPGSVQEEFILPRSHLSRCYRLRYHSCSPPVGLGRAIHPPLDFAPDKVCRAPSVAKEAVGSYSTFSPLLNPASAHFLTKPAKKF